MALSDERQRIMPTMDDRVNGQPLAFPEAVLLTNPADSQLKGEVPLNPFLPYISIINITLLYVLLLLRNDRNITF
jgi:hypothetical protein